MNRHLVTFYEDEMLLARQVSNFIGAGLQAKGAAVVIATKPHRDAIERQLRDSGLIHGHVANTDARTYLALDAQETLSSFMDDGMPDAERFEDTIGPILTKASQGGRRQLWLFGEMVALLFEGGNADAAIRLEELWNKLGEKHPFSLLCAYPIGAASRKQDCSSLIKICAQHASATLPDKLWTTKVISLK